jgi:hypothetical protein
VRPKTSVAKKDSAKKRYKLRLFSVESDAKTIKGSKRGYLTAVMYLAPAKEADGVHNMCPMATEGLGGCIDSCLDDSGLALVYKTIKAARIKKTLWLINDRVGFIEAARKDIRKLQRYAAEARMTPVVRFNGTSDQPWLALLLAPEFPDVVFYDYTKIPRPYDRMLPNYSLTFSFSGCNLDSCLDALANGVNVAVVFADANFPATWNGYPVVNGDESDLRFLDAKGVIVGLKAKGVAKKAPVGSFIQISGLAS